MSKWTQNQIEEDFADLHGSVWDAEIIDERRDAFQEMLQEVKARVWREAFAAAVSAVPGDVWFDSWDDLNNPYV